MLLMSNDSTAQYTLYLTNKTSETIYVAIAYPRPNAVRIMNARGWMVLKPGATYTREFAYNFVYLYAEGQSGKEYNNHDRQFCLTNKSFVGNSKSTYPCDYQKYFGRLSLKSPVSNYEMRPQKESSISGSDVAAAGVLLGAGYLLYKAFTSGSSESKSYTPAPSSNYSSGYSSGSSSQRDNTCYKCKGSGKCLNCNGRSRINCSRCNGDGKYSSLLITEESCSGCDGKGWYICSRCSNGACSNCKGTGKD